MDRVYIETTIVSYLTARESQNVVVAGHQKTTHEWWEDERRKYELCISDLVEREAGAGDPDAAKDWLAVLQSMTLLETTPHALALAKELLAQAALPSKAADDALHIAVAASQNIQYLLTWNCKHLANAVMRPLIEAVCKDFGFNAPIICTPEELLGGQP